MLENVTVCVCTYNEEGNIRECISAIKKNGVKKILVIDAGTDGTKAIAEDLGVDVICCEKGLARQRQKAIESCQTEFLAFVDADDRLKSDCISCLLREMEDEKYDAIQAISRVFKPRSYWEKATDATWKYSMSKTGLTNMIGRPAIYRTKAIKDAGADLSFVNIGDEDAAISMRMEKKGYRQGIGSGICYNKCPSTYEDNKKAWEKYGKGDAMLIKRYPEKKWSIYYHLLWNYPIKRSWKLIRNGRVVYCLYPILMGWHRFITMRRFLK